MQRFRQLESRMKLGSTIIYQPIIQATYIYHCSPGSYIMLNKVWQNLTESKYKSDFKEPKSINIKWIGDYLFGFMWRGTGGGGYFFQTPRLPCTRIYSHACLCHIRRLRVCLLLLQHMGSVDSSDLHNYCSVILYYEIISRKNYHIEMKLL